MGALPALGQWVRLTVSAESLGLGGKKLTGMTFKTYGGQAWFDRSGKGTCTVSAPPPASPQSGSITVWVNDALPTGAVPAGTWVWDTAQKATGLKSNTEPSAPGSHAHSFTGATFTVTPGVGESLVAYILASNCDPPREIMMEWYDGSWEHRAFWGEDLIPLGTLGTASRRSMGAIPTPGQWIRVFVPAASVGLENRTLTGLSLRLYNGKTWFDTIGVASAGFGSFDRKVGPIVASVTADYIDRPAAPMAISPSRRYSLYTPELQLMAETDLTTAATPTISNEYVYFGGQPLAQIEATGAVHYHFNDHLGTPLLTTNSSGTIDWRVEREPYGSRYSVRVDRYQPLALPGQEDDASNDRSYNIFRLYRSAWGRYTQSDAIGDHSYVYGRANPMLYADPLGLVAIQQEGSSHGVSLRELDRLCRTTTGGLSGGACTPYYLAWAECPCTCGQSGYTMAITAHINFNIVVFAGNWHQLLQTRTPHHSVTGMNSAIQHEFDYHLDPSARMLRHFLEPYEATTYSTESECEAACQDVRGNVNAEFRRWMRTTQAIEEGGGDPRSLR